MEKKSIGKLILGEWNTKTIVAVAIGAALYGVLMAYGSIPVFTNTMLTTAMVVPVLVGGMFGPVPAMVALLIGNMFADILGGWGMWFDWSIGNGIIGFFVGLLPVYGARIMDGVFKVKHMIIYAVCCILGNVIGLGVITPIFSSLFYGAELEVTFIQSFFATVSNTSVLIIVGIPVLWIISNRMAARGNLKAEPEAAIESSPEPAKETAPEAAPEENKEN
jgi:energy-coupling factor transport system substrate-specific component